MAVVYPVTWPIAKVLSWVVGDQEGLIYRRAELKELMRLHSCQELGDLDVGEVAIIQSVLDLKDKRARDVRCALMLCACKFIKAYCVWLDHDPAGAGVHAGCGCGADG